MLLGATATSAYTGHIGVTPAAIRRWARGPWTGSLLACPIDLADGAVDATGRVFAALGSGVVRFDGDQQGGTTCQGNSPGFPLDSAAPVQNFRRLLLGAQHLYALTADRVIAVDPSGAAAPVEVGPAETFSVPEPWGPLAVEGDAVIYVASGALPGGGPPAYALVLVESPGAQPHVLGTAMGTVTAIASGGGFVYFADDRGLCRVPRT